MPFIAKQWSATSQLTSLTTEHRDRSKQEVSDSRGYLQLRSLGRLPLNLLHPSLLLSVYLTQQTEVGLDCEGLFPNHSGCTRPELWATPPAARDRYIPSQSLVHGYKTIQFQDFKMRWPWSGNSDKPTDASNPQNESPKPRQITQSATNDLKKGAADFDPKKLPDREKLPKKLQTIVDKSDKEDNFFDELVDG